MRRTGRAAIFLRPGQPLELREFDVPDPLAGQILVRVTCCTICGSDLHTISGRRSAPTPSVLGHEIIGEVVAFGPCTAHLAMHGKPIEEGDRITWTVTASCQKCFFCEHRLLQKCERLFKYGHQSWEPDGAWSGGLAEWCIIRPASGIVKLPSGLPDEVASPASCATATIMGAFRTIGPVHQESVLVQGAGMLGLTACAIARASGAAEIICTDLNDQRLALAERFGATRVCRADPEALRETVREATARRGVDVALELTGSPDAIETGLDLVRIGGRYAWIGSVLPTRSIPVNPEAIVRRHLTIYGLHNYSAQDLHRAIEVLDQYHRQFPFADLVGAIYPLDAVNEAIGHASRGSAVRVGVKPNL